jgi:flagellar hook-length control protein FliK
MNANLLTIDNMFAGTTGTTPVPSRPDAAGRDTKFSVIPDDGPLQVKAPDTTTPDNIAPDTPKRPISKPPKGLSPTPGKRTTTEAPRKAENSTDSTEQGASSDTAGQPDAVQSWLAQNSVPVGQSKEGAAAIGAKAGRRLAQLLANSRTEKPPPVTGQAAKSDEIKFLLTTDKGQLGLKTVLPETSNGQRGLKAVLPNTSKIIPAAKTQLGTGENADKIPVSGKTAVDTKGLTNTGNASELMPEAANTSGKTATAGQKPTIADTLPVADTEKAPAPSTKDLTLEAQVDDNGKATNAAGETTTAKTSIPTVQVKPSETQPQLVGVDSGKPVPTAEPDAKTAAPQTRSKALDADGKEPVQAKNDLSAPPTVRKSNATELDTSTGQTKDRGSSTSNNRPNPNLEQMLSRNDPQTLIAEQSPASAAKTANLPSTDVSADVGKQILESVRTSLSQQGGDRQITVRLNPPELGKVFIRFQEQDNQLTGLLEVSKTQTRLEIEQALPQIIRNLTDCGVQIRRLDVVLSDGDRSQQDAPEDQSLQNNNAQQQDSANPETRREDPNAGEISEWSANNNGYQSISELQETLVTDGSINMLV